MYAPVTVNIEKLEYGLAAVDTNNSPGIDKWLYERGIARPTVIHLYSGYCMYPVMRFDLTKI